MSLHLTVNMKAVVALIISWMIFLVAGIGFTLIVGPFDIYAVASLLFLIPYGLLAFFSWKRRVFAYLGNTVLSVVLLLVIPTTMGQEQMPPILVWETNLATILLALMALQSFKAYLESKTSA